MRTAYGYERTVCDCETCTTNCKVMPGCLAPGDLDTMIPAGADPFLWSESNLLASPGAVVAKNGQIFTIPTLVPASKPDGSCIHLSPEGLCQIHEISPVGCAFFDCGPDRRDGLMEQLLSDIYIAHQSHQLYWHLWVHLAYKGLTREAPAILRERMRKENR